MLGENFGEREKGHFPPSGSKFMSLRERLMEYLDDFTFCITASLHVIINRSLTTGEERV